MATGVENEEQGELDPIEVGLREAERQLDAAEKHHGVGSQDAIVCLKTIGTILNDMERYPEALGYFIRAREAIETYLGPNHPLMSDVIAGIGENYLRQSMLVEAQMYFEKAFGVREAIGRGDDIHSAGLLVKMGEMYCITSDFEKAKSHLMKALDIFGSSKSNNETVLGDLNHNLGVIAASEELYGQAKGYLEKASRLRESAYGVRAIETSQSLWGLATVCEALNEREKARELYYQVYQIRQELMGDSDPLVEQAREKVDALYIAPTEGGRSNTPHPAAELGTPVQGGMPQAFQHYETEVVVHLLSASTLLLECGRIEQAKELLAQCLSLYGVTDLHEKVDIHAIIRGLSMRFPELKQLVR